MKGLKPVSFFSEKDGLSKSFARMIRLKYEFGEKWGGTWYCTEKEWNDALKRHIASAGNTQAGKPHKVKRREK